MDTLTGIKNSALIGAVLNDSCGGIMYDVSNRNKYDKQAVADVLAQWDSLTAVEKGAADGILKGAIHFLQDCA